MIRYVVPIYDIAVDATKRNHNIYYIVISNCKVLVTSH